MIHFATQYNDREEVVLWMNTVGPYHNRQETYAYFSLPFCSGQKSSISHYHETLSEALQGVELEFSGYEMEFKSDAPKSVICMVTLQEESAKAFTYAVKNEYWYQMYIDGLPIWEKSVSATSAMASTISSRTRSSTSATMASKSWISP